MKIVLIAIGVIAVALIIAKSIKKKEKGSNETYNYK